MHSSDLDATKDYIFTIGHSNISFDQFLKLLRDYEIEAVADVRSQPYSKHTPHFSQQPLSAQLEGSGISYEFMGDQLGGRPDGPDFYDEQGYVRYDKWSQDERFLDGIASLESIATRRRWAIMCSEGDARACHRHLLLARVLADRGWPKDSIVHIEPDGTCISEDLLPAQHDLFGGTVSWRSPQSVLQRVQRSISSSD